MVHVTRPCILLLAVTCSIAYTSNLVSAEELSIWDKYQVWVNGVAKDAGLVGVGNRCFTATDDDKYDKSTCDHVQMGVSYLECGTIWNLDLGILKAGAGVCLLKLWIPITALVVAIAIAASTLSAIVRCIRGNV